MQNFPIFKYPSTILLVDDDILFTKSLEKYSDSKNKYKSFNDPQEALYFLKNYQSYLKNKIDFLRPCLEDEDFENIDRLPVDINLEAFEKIRNYSQKNEEISVIIVDYNMPSINGLDFLKQISHLSCKKILLTGEATHEEAVKSFNEGIIDKFIRKDSQDLLFVLNKTLAELTDKFFLEITANVHNHIEIQYKLPTSDPVYCEYLKNKFFEYSIEEYFLINKQGDFIGLQSNREAFYFIVHNDRTLLDFISLYEDSDYDKKFMEKIKNREIVPFFGEKNEAWQFSYTEWDEFFYKPQIIKGKNFYYSVITKYF